ncbi:hypothetical protein ACFL20_05355 [Spirochaetota bacterium]
MVKNRLIPIIILLIVIPIKSQAKEFLNTFLHINLGVMVGLTYGDIMSYENKIFSDIETYRTEDPIKDNPEYYDMSLGIMIDLSPFPPLILGNEAHAVKFGIRGGYRFHSLTQNISIEEGSQSEVDYGGDLISFGTWMVGPVIHYAPSIKMSDISDAYSAEGGFTFFFLYGQLNNGTLSKQPSVRSYIDSISGTPLENYETSVTGFKIDVGIGGEVSLCAINFGVNLFYSFMRIKMKENVYGSGVSRTTTINEACLEIYIGIPVGEQLFSNLF